MFQGVPLHRLTTNGGKKCGPVWKDNLRIQHDAK